MEKVSEDTKYSDLLSLAKKYGIKGIRKKGELVAKINEYVDTNNAKTSSKDKSSTDKSDLSASSKGKTTESKTSSDKEDENKSSKGKTVESKTSNEVEDEITSSTEETDKSRSPSNKTVKTKPSKGKKLKDSTQDDDDMKDDYKELDLQNSQSNYAVDQEVNNLLSKYKLQLESLTVDKKSPEYKKYLMIDNGNYYSKICPFYLYFDTTYYARKISSEGNNDIIAAMESFWKVNPSKLTFKITNIDLKYKIKLVSAYDFHTAMNNVYKILLPILNGEKAIYDEYTYIRMGKRIENIYLLDYMVNIIAVNNKKKKHRLENSPFAIFLNDFDFDFDGLSDNIRENAIDLGMSIISNNSLWFNNDKSVEILNEKIMKSLKDLPLRKLKVYGDNLYSLTLNIVSTINHNRNKYRRDPYYQEFTNGLYVDNTGLRYYHDYVIDI